MWIEVRGQQPNENDVYTHTHTHMEYIHIKRRGVVMEIMLLVIPMIVTLIVMMIMFIDLFKIGSIMQYCIE